MEIWAYKYKHLYEINNFRYVAFVDFGSSVCSLYRNRHQVKFIRKTQHAHKLRNLFAYYKFLTITFANFNAIY